MLIYLAKDAVNNMQIKYYANYFIGLCFYVHFGFTVGIIIITKQ